MTINAPTLSTAWEYLESLRRKPDSEKLAGMQALRTMFREAGHNPDDPADKMYDTINMAKPFFDQVLGNLSARIK